MVETREGPGVKRMRGGKKKLQECPVCGFRERSVRQHVTARHFPPVFSREAWDDPELDHLRFKEIICLINDLGLQSLDDAMLFVHRIRLIILKDSLLLDKDQALLKRVCRRFFWSIPIVFHVARVNSWLLFFDWRVMAAFRKLCEPELRSYFHAQRFGGAAWSSRLSRLGKLSWHDTQTILYCGGDGPSDWVDSGN